MKLLLALSLLFASKISWAGGDRINNGGGVWACENAQRVTFDYMFMDVFEARREYQLILPEISIAALDNVQIQKEWLRKHLDVGAEIIKHIEYVEKNITWIDDVINYIPDAANRISPHPSTCPQGSWVPVQLVNFTDDFRVLVRREIFNSDMLTELERSAVYLHEGLYSYLRTVYQDANSIRARALTGYLLSNLSDKDKIARILKSLSKKIEDPGTTDPLGWICGIKPERDSALYTAISKDKKLATDDVIKSCIVGEDRFGGGFPGSENPFVFPGFPGPPNECKENKVYCEEIKSHSRTSKCVLTDFFGTKVAEANGRTKLEAQQETIRQCLAATGEKHTCYRADKMTCK